MVSKKGFIEEDSSIISVMIARGKNMVKPGRICFKIDYLPTSSSFRQVNQEDRKDIRVIIVKVSNL